jgi:hypothetical protein
MPLPIGAALLTAVALVLGPGTARAAPCNVPDPENSPAFEAFELFVAHAYGRGSSDWAAGLSAMEAAQVRGHALGRIALASSQADARNTVTNCLLVAIARRYYGAISLIDPWSLWGLSYVKALMRAVNEAAMGMHDDNVFAATGVRDASPAEAYFEAVGLASPGGGSGASGPRPRTAAVPAPAPHSWQGLCQEEILARGHRPVFHLSFPPRGSMDVFDDPDSAGYIGISGCAHHPFDKTAFERDHRVMKMETPAGTQFYRIVTYRHHTQNNWVTLSFYRSGAPVEPAVRPHPWDGLCAPAILAQGYRPIFQFSVDTFLLTDVFADPVSNTYVMVNGCSRNPFDMTDFHRDFEEKDTSYLNTGPYFKAVKFKHRRQNNWATLKYYRR